MGGAVVSVRRVLTGAEEMRSAVRLFDSCSESFLDRFTAEQLILIWRAWHASEWDVRPDLWSERQVQAALKGVAPRWDNDMNPVDG